MDLSQDRLFGGVGLDVLPVCAKAVTELDVPHASPEDFGTSGGGVALNFFDAGSWQASSGGGGSTVPEPSYPALIGIGFAAIMVVRRRLA